MHLFLCFRVMVKDPFHANCLPVHIGTLVELGKANGTSLVSSKLEVGSYSFFLVLHLTSLSVYFPPTELFYLSHKLVDLYPNNPVSVHDTTRHLSR